MAGLYPLDEKQILYLYGAVSMSVMAGVIFLACHFKKKNQMCIRDRVNGWLSVLHRIGVTQLIAEDMSSQQIQAGQYIRCV